MLDVSRVEVTSPSDTRTVGGTIRARMHLYGPDGVEYKPRQVMKARHSWRVLDPTGAKVVHRYEKRPRGAASYIYFKSPAAGPYTIIAEAEGMRDTLVLMVPSRRG